MKPLYLLLLFLLIACSSPQKSFDKGNYDAAYTAAFKAVKKGKDVSKNKRLLIKTMEKLVERDLSEINSLYETATIRSEEKAMKVLYKLEDRIAESKAYIGNRHEEASADLIELNTLLSNSLKSKYIDSGNVEVENYERRGEKKYAQKACIAYSQAINYSLQRDQELEKATEDICAAAIIIYYVEAEAPFEIFYNSEIDRRFDDLENQSDDFLKIYYESSPPSNPDCAINIYFNDLDERFNDNTQEQDFSEEVITGYRTETDTSGVSREVPIYENVSGRVRIVTSTKRLLWEVQTRIESNNINCNLSGFRFEAIADSTIEYYELSGDERAIPDRFKNQQREDYQSTSRMVDVLLEQIYEEVEDAYFD
jgi:hypothetical protein